MVLTLFCVNFSVAVLYEMALKYEKGSAISSSGALMCRSGDKTGRSPKGSSPNDFKQTNYFLN